MKLRVNEKELVTMLDYYVKCYLNKLGTVTGISVCTDKTYGSERQFEIELADA